MIKVMFVINNLSYGGAQKILTYVANLLNRNEFSVCVLNQAQEIPAFRALNEDVMILGHKSFTRRYIRRFQELRYIVKTVKKENIDVIVSFLDIPNFFATIAGLLCHIPVIISERGDPSQATIINKMMQNFEVFASGAVFQTEGAKAYYPKLLQIKSAVIPNPVERKNIDIPFLYEKNIRRIAFVGRFECVQKRQDLAIEALNEVLKTYPDVILNFYGGGPDEEMCINKAKELGVFSNAIFHGKTEDIQNALYENDLYLITSDYEGIPNSLLEAMAIGMPVISTDCSPGGAAMLIGNNKNGVLVPRNDLRALVDAILKMIQHPDIAKECGQNAKKRCDDFSRERILTLWEEYIKNVYYRGKRKK